MPAMVVKTMGLIVIDLESSVLLLDLTGSASGGPSMRLMPGARVTPPETLEAVPDGKKGGMVVSSARGA
jgi:hypothetical protein